MNEYAENVIAESRMWNDSKVVEYQTEGISPAGKPAYKIVYTYDKGDQVRGKTLETGVIEDVVYFLVYDAKEAAYSKYLPIVENMIYSFEIS